MDAGPNTPLVEFFRRGDVPRDVRLLAARGALAPRAHEQLGLLMLLVNDPDAEIAAAAEQTLESILPETLAAFLARSDVSTELRHFFAERGIQPSTPGEGGDERPLVDRSAEVTPVDEEDSETARVSVAFKVAALSVPERMALALKGSREERSILVRDSNKIVALAALSSPKITEVEVEAIARMPNVSDEILRIIGRTRAWVKNYRIAVALIKNPKTPVALSMRLLPRLTEKALKMLSTDRNVADVVRTTARRKVVFAK